MKKIKEKFKSKIKVSIHNFKITIQASLTEIKHKINKKIKNILIRNKKRLIIGSSYILIIIILFLWNNPFFITDLLDGDFSLNNLQVQEINNITTKESNIALNNNPTNWIWPTSNNYTITSRYSSYHTGIDIIPQDGNFNVYATFPGEIVTSSYKTDNGNYIVIKHDDGKYTMNAHLQTRYLSVGTKVNQGDIIGIIGSTGNATGRHLHFSVWNAYPHNSEPINPWILY